MNNLLEICVDSVESAIAAEQAGADRLELCGNLIIGGTSPSIELFNIVREKTKIKVNVIIRPRFGDFCYSDYEFEILKREVDLFREAGADGIVIGILKPDGTLDMPRMKSLIDLSEGMEVTLHRCFDLTKDPFEALEQAEQLGVNTILTSGQKNKAAESMTLLDQLQKKAKTISIMAGSGIDFETVKIMLEKTCIKTYHMSGKKTIDSQMVYRKEGVPMGLPVMSEYGIWVTDKDEVAKVKSLLQ